MEIKRIKESIKKTREWENMRAKLAKQDAIIDYIAMMSDVELPNESEDKNEQLWKNKEILWPRVLERRDGQKRSCQK